jgi:flagellar biosynthesis protein FliQ
MNVTDLTNAIIQGINAGGEQFLEGTLAAVLPILWLVILALHLGRPYMLSMMSKFTLRLGADLLWMVYAGARDFLIVTGFVMSFMYFFPDVVNADPLPVTGGLAASCLFAVLLVKLVSKGDDNDARVYTITSGLLALGALLYLIPYVLGTQANAVAADGLGNLSTALVSNTNPVLAAWLSLIAVGVVAVLGIAAVVYSLRAPTKPAATESAA